MDSVVGDDFGPRQRPFGNQNSLRFKQPDRRSPQHAVEIHGAMRGSCCRPRGRRPRAHQRSGKGREAHHDNDALSLPRGGSRGQRQLILTPLVQQSAALSHLLKDYKWSVRAAPRQSLRNADGLRRRRKALSCLVRNILPRVLPARLSMGPLSVRRRRSVSWVVRLSPAS